MIKTKKYNFPNLMIVNSFTYDKLVQFSTELNLMKIHWELKTLRDFKILVRDEPENNKVYFYVNKRKEGVIVEYSFEDLLK